MEYIEFNNNSDHKYAEKRQYNCLLLQMHDKKKIYASPKYGPRFKFTTLQLLV